MKKAIRKHLTKIVVSVFVFTSAVLPFVISNANPSMPQLPEVLGIPSPTPTDTIAHSHPDAKCTGSLSKDKDGNTVFKCVGDPNCALDPKIKDLATLTAQCTKQCTNRGKLDGSCYALCINDGCILVDPKPMPTPKPPMPVRNQSKKLLANN
jgi:hypothetical protein